MNRVLLFILFTSLVAACGNEKEHVKNFRELSSSETHIEFENTPASREGLSILYYIYYYNGAGVATGDINNDGLVDIYFTANNKGGNKLYLNKGNMQFEDITEKAGVAGSADWCTGVTMADVNADGLLDIYVCAVSKKHGLTGRNELFINNGNGTFTESAAQYGLDFSGYSTQAVFFDYDHDGDLDCFILNQSDRPNQYIVDTSIRRKFDPNAGDRLMRNDLNTTAGKFTDVTEQAGIYRSNIGYGLGIAVADLNNDGWEDIYVGNDFHENDYYYINNGNGTFTESGAKAFNHYSRFSMGNDIADYNNDGNLDVLTVDMLPPDEKTLKTYGSDERVDIYNFKIINNGYQQQVSRNCLQRNNGNGTSFSEVGLAAGIAATDWSWTPLIADFDNDGNKDIFISSGIVKRPVDLDYVRFVSDLARQKQFNASENLDEKALEKMPEGSSWCYLFKGDGEGKFADSSKEWGIANRKGFFTGAAYADLDNDGDLDIVVNPLQSKAFIYENNSPRKNYLQLNFKGDSLNKFGIGVKAWLFQKGKMQYQQLMFTRGFQSASCQGMHFGLDNAGIDSLLVVWPDQRYQVLHKVDANKRIPIDHTEATGKFSPGSFIREAPPVFKLMPSLLKREWKHKEDPFDDFAMQYLIPHSLSTRGPKLAVADVNHDGLDDFFACGAIGQPGQLFVQTREGKFISADTSVFAQDANCEDVDAAFVDVNGDGFPDLYVASGGNVYKGNNPYLQDRLYLNDGHGHFTKSNNLPALYANKSCVAVGDVDGDGDQDIFVGVLAAPQAYGVPQTSYLLINDGKGNFKIADDQTIDIKNIGMVTAAAIADMNGDGKNDIIIAGEWMPMTIFINEQNKFRPHSIQKGSGLWQSLVVADVNGDGAPDILGGNWGLNSKLAAGKNGPLKLYVKDFDNNGTTEPILAYTINNKEYPFLPKDEIEQVLPGIKKKFLYYSGYAGKTVDEIFDIQSGNVLKLTADDLASAVFINDGKGNFARHDLSIDLQLTPIFAFLKPNRGGSYLAGGNFFGVLPYEGRYDAVSLLSFDPVEAIGRTSRPSPNELGSELYRLPAVLDTKGQVRDIKSLHTANGDVVVVAKNNDALMFYKFNSNPGTK